MERNQNEVISSYKKNKHVNKTKFKRIVTLSVGVLVVFLIISGGGYTYWNNASPDKTCMSCHEINPSIHTWQNSAHSKISCFECHGTALENGIHSLKEKSMMIFKHLSSEDVRNEEIRMSEEQVLATMDRCVKCHQSEFAAWKKGGHSASYADIFLDEKHNKTEQLNEDCMRCHGMFYEGKLSDLVAPIDVKGPWNLKDPKKNNHAAIPCLACHSIHTEGQFASTPDYSNPNKIHYNRLLGNSPVDFYSRHERKHISLNDLPRPTMLLFNDTIKTPEMAAYKLCVQCHAPSVTHQVGTGDDRTPVGVHEGISCNVCHKTHSNEQRNACAKCHSAITNCKIDVTTMNTTYLSPDSPNDIHFLSCRNCHGDNDMKVK